MTGKNAPNLDAAADFFLLQQDYEAGDSITHLKLQKLVYYAQAWHLAFLKTPLFNEKIEAWAHGPVVPRLYARFADWGWQNIEPSVIRTNPDEIFDYHTLGVLDAVWDRYGSLTAKQLEVLTHREDPWRRAYRPEIPGGACTNEITRAAIEDYFSPE